MKNTVPNRDVLAKHYVRQDLRLRQKLVDAYLKFSTTQHTNVVSISKARKH